MPYQTISTSNPPTFLICGGSGQVGQSIVEQAIACGIRAVAPPSRMLDITDGASISDALQCYKPTLIINATAYTDVDAAESDAARAFAINSDGAHLAAIPLFHISTDYVFSGEGSEPIGESHPTIRGTETSLKQCCAWGVSGQAFRLSMIRWAHQPTRLVSPAC